MAPRAEQRRRICNMQYRARPGRKLRVQERAKGTAHAATGSESVATRFVGGPADGAVS